MFTASPGTVGLRSPVSPKDSVCRMDVETAEAAGAGEHS